MAHQLSEEEIAVFKMVFDTLDKDGDGTITAKELEESGVVTEIMNDMGYKPTEEVLQASIQAFINSIDENGNGAIDLPEFLTLITDVFNDASDGEDDEMKEAFGVFDIDGSGYISKAELRYVMNSLGEEITDEVIDEMMKEADTNEDGQINYNEFVMVMMAHLK